MTNNHCVLGRNEHLENVITTWHDRRDLALVASTQLTADYPHLTFVVVSPKERP